MLTEQNISAGVATGHRQNEEGTCQILGSNANLIKRLIRYKLKYMLSAYISHFFVPFILATMK